MSWQERAWRWFVKWILAPSIAYPLVFLVAIFVETGRMGRIIKQDDGKFGLYSTVSDEIWAFDCDEKEMIRIWKKRAAERAEIEMEDWLENVTGDRPHPDKEYVMPLDDALESHQFQGSTLDEELRALMKEHGIVPSDERQDEEVQ
jgi:hypothetical protein